MSRIFFNIEGNYVGNRGSLLDIAAHSKPIWATVINSIQLAKDLRNASPLTKVIFREKTNDDPSEDSNVWERINPQDYANFLMKNGNKEDWLYVLNEPSVSDIKTLSRWLVECSKEILHRGFAGVVLANFAVGNIILKDVKDGGYDELIKFAGENKDRVRIGLHEGSGCLFPIGCGLIPFENIINSTYPISLPNVPETWLGEYTENFFHILRYQWLQKRADEIPAKKPKYVITECCIDNLSDLENNLLKHLEQKYQIPKLRGWRTYAPIWHEILQLPVENAYIKQLEWIDKQYPADVDGIMIFTWWNNFKQWETFDVSDTTKIHNWLKSYISPIIMEEEPVNVIPSENDLRWEEGETVASAKSDFANVREEPTVNSNIVIRLTKNNLVRIILEASIQKDDGRWIPIRFLDNVGKWSIAGWIRSDVLVFKSVLQINAPYNPEISKNNILIEAIQNIVSALE